MNLILTLSGTHKNIKELSVKNIRIVYYEGKKRINKVITPVVKKFETYDIPAGYEDEEDTMLVISMDDIPGITGREVNVVDFNLYFIDDEDEYSETDILSSEIAA